MTRQDQLQERMIARHRNDVLYCPSCDSEIRQEQLDRCAICQERGCTRCLHEIDTGERVCENHKDTPLTPLQDAAAKCAAHGTHRNLKRYLQAKRNIT